MKINNELLRRAAVGALLYVAAGASAETVDEVVDVKQQQLESAIEHQQQVDELDDETVALLSQYHTELERLADLETYNANMRKMRASQDAEKLRLTQELKDIEVVRRDLLPLMTEMTDLLARFIQLDQPLLLEEREARVAALADTLNRSDVALGEKYRRAIEAYQIEAEYGQNIEAYEGALQRDDRELTVDYLRVGRLALYYVSLDRREAALWHPGTRQWQQLDADHVDMLDFALRVARKQAPPNLLELPLWTEAFE